MKRSVVALMLLAVVLCARLCPAQGEVDLLARLKAGDFKTVEESLMRTQRAYEEGKIDEFALREAYRPLYAIDGTARHMLDVWIQASPTSYPARVIRGTYLKRAAGAARGTAYISKTSPAQLQAMERFFAMATNDLAPSLTLTAKPLLSVFHLLDVYGTGGDEKGMAHLYRYVNETLPSSTLLRCRYALYLKPRWGGSYDAMRAFMAETKKTCDDPAMPAKIEAIMEDDMGSVAVDAGNRAEAVQHFTKALELGDAAGGVFRKEWLIESAFFVCKWPELARFCVPGTGVQAPPRATPPAVP